MQIAKSQLRPFFFFLDKKWYGSDFGKTFLGPVLFALVVFIPVFGVFELYKLIERLWNHAEIFWGRSVWNLLSFTTPGLVYVFKIWWFFLSCGIGVTCYEWLDRKIHQSSKLGHNNSWWICLTPRIFGVFIFILLMLFFASFGEFLKIFGNE
jgi:hypothetical protein